MTGDRASKATRTAAIGRRQRDGAAAGAAAVASGSDARPRAGDADVDRADGRELDPTDSAMAERISPTAPRARQSREVVHQWYTAPSAARPDRPKHPATSRHCAIADPLKATAQDTRR